MGNRSQLAMVGVWHLSAQQLANELTGQLAVIGSDVEMRDRSDHERAQRGDLHSTFCGRDSDWRSGNRSGVDHDNIRLNCTRHDSGWHTGGYRRCKDARGCMIIRESLHMMIKRVQAGGGEHAGLPPAPT